MFRRNLIGLVASFVLLSSAAFAETEGTDWSGWYVGAYGGHAWGEVTTDDVTHFYTTDEFDDDGYTYGAFVMRRWQTESNFIYGAELIIPFYLEEGTAEDNTFFPGLVSYEADPQYGAMLGAHAGQAFDEFVLYLFGTAGFAVVEGHTYNVDNNDVYTPGFVQTSEATHFIWQAGIGAEFEVAPNVILGGRAAHFATEREDHTMSWNTPGPNEFGLDAFYVEFRIAYRFGAGS